MKTVIIHGQSHEGSTCHIARNLAGKIGGEMTEFFLPRDFGEFCVGCTRCFMENEALCPHYDKLRPITEAMDAADVIILASPVYVYHATGAMKAFLDHYGYRWMVHRPEETMFRKQGVVISTAAGAGTKTTNKDMADSLTFWGVGKIFKYGCAVAATSWDHIDPQKKNGIEQQTAKIADRIRSNHGRVKPGLKAKGLFYIMRLYQKKGHNRKDKDYWLEKGWMGKRRPWK
ncbi:MAG: NAD(P)H-dependent oxidoreductase [Bacillota bacterium]|nr:NAD(P)H-dependent oxidoreductase [Bacillota bacterium]